MAQVFRPGGLRLDESSLSLFESSQALDKTQNGGSVMGNVKPRKPVHPPVYDLRAVRELCGITLDDLARRITAEGFPITKSGLGNIETGERGPSRDFLEAHRRALHTFSSQVLGGRVVSTPEVIDREARAAARARARAGVAA